MKKLIIPISILLSLPVFSAEYLVKLKESKTLLNKNLNIQSTFELSFGKFSVININPDQLSQLKSYDEVEYIEPNQVFSVDTIQDTEYEKQWGLKNNGKNSGNIFFPGIKGMDINAEKAWTITTGSKEVKIAVIDTGVDYQHEDLKENIMINESEFNGQEGVDDDGNGYIDDIYGYDFANNDNDPMDGHGHGTHCAGVIGATHNDIGIRGVMSKVEILPIQFLTVSGQGTLEGAIKAIDYATSRGVNIMSNSWGGGEPSKALTEAIAKAEKAGILFVAAAGNSNSNNDIKPTAPANTQINNVISVGAMDGKAKRANFSNYGEKTVHVFAPGVNIYSTVQNNKYKKMSGTSMACPFIAGVAGLIMANEPNLTYKEVKSRIMTHAKEGNKLKDYSVSGFVDSFQSLEH